MKRFWGICLILTVATALSLFGQERLRVGILSFGAKNGVAEGEAEVVAELFRNAIVNTGKYDVLDRENMDSILEEQEFQASGCTESECAVRIGQMLNMQYMFFGSLMKLGKSYIVSVGFVDVETSKIVKTAESKFTVIDNADVAVRHIAATLTVKEGEKEPPPPGSTKNMLKPLSLVGGLTFAGAGAGFMIAGAVKGGEAYDLYETYSQLTFGMTELGFDTAWQDAEDAKWTANVFYGLGYASLGLAGALMLFWVLQPEYTSSTTVFLAPTPRYDGLTFTLTRRF